MIKSIVLIIIGFIFLIKGADFLVDGASSIAKRFHIPEIIMGITVVSIGTSIPEFFISLTSAVSGHADMAVGNIIGSNLSNLLLILGLSAVIRPIKFKRETRNFDIPICIIVTVIFFVMCNIGYKISRIDGIILVVLCIIFIIYTIIMSKKGENYDKEDEVKNNTNEKDKKEKNNLLVDIICIILGIVALKFGGEFTVENSVNIAQTLGLSEKIIGVTILAIGTSLPELVTSIVASIKNESDLAIGNVIGSCIFNILLIVGVTGIITPLSYNLSYNKDMSILLIATITLLVFAIIPPKNKMSRMNGVIYFLMYIVYMMVLVT